MATASIPLLQVEHLTMRFGGLVAIDDLSFSKVTVGVECLWRIVTRGRVALTSEDHGHQFGLPAPVDAVARCTELFSTRHVSAVTLREDTADLAIEFTDDLRLEVIPTSAGYESWRLHDPSGTSYFVQGGGQICIWKP